MSHATNVCVIISRSVTQEVRVVTGRVSYWLYLLSMDMFTGSSSGNPLSLLIVFMLSRLFAKSAKVIIAVALPTLFAVRCMLLRHGGGAI